MICNLWPPGSLLGAVRGLSLQMEGEKKQSWQKHNEKDKGMKYNEVQSVIVVNNQ